MKRHLLSGLWKTGRDTVTTTDWELEVELLEVELEDVELDTELEVELLDVDDADDSELEVPRELTLEELLELDVELDDE